MEQNSQGQRHTDSCMGVCEGNGQSAGKNEGSADDRADGAGAAAEACAGTHPDGTGTDCGI